MISRRGTATEVVRVIILIPDIGSKKYSSKAPFLFHSFHTAARCVRGRHAAQAPSRANVCRLVLKAKIWQSNRNIPGNHMTLRSVFTALLVRPFNCRYCFVLGFSTHVAYWVRSFQNALIQMRFCRVWDSTLRNFTSLATLAHATRCPVRRLLGRFDKLLKCWMACFLFLLHRLEPADNVESHQLQGRSRVQEHARSLNPHFAHFIVKTSHFIVM